ncbi:hypothetical protein BLNAU_6273 [Blattamonas nauphoetae]|uniref:Uncharacterized protein n=1 Tax=Blattamonas nauphoetae TaxID=2049346 RepID=A0ABQ9Y4U5_9EUKA|nr:hypothetical protein BLNAU_6273 [Blattamonas nauphoetae]
MSELTPVPTPGSITPTRTTFLYTPPPSSSPEGDSSASQPTPIKFTPKTVESESPRSDSGSEDTTPIQCVILETGDGGRFTVPLDLIEQSDTLMAMLHGSPAFREQKEIFSVSPSPHSSPSNHGKPGPSAKQ